MPSISNALRILDNYVSDYTPISLLTAPIALGFKCVYFRYILSGSTDEKIKEAIKERKIFSNNYFTHVDSKSGLRYFVSLIPIIGNFGLICSDLYDKYTGSKLFKKAKAHTLDPDQTVYLSYLQQAANKGHLLACTILAIRPDAKIKQSDRIQYLRKAVLAGIALAQLNLGRAYSKGEGTIQSPERATQLYQLAAKQGLAEEAQRALEELNAKKATEAAGQGSPLEQDAKTRVEVAVQSPDEFDLIERYLQGDSEVEDPKKATEMLQKAAAKGHMAACYALGQRYERGDGIEPDKKLAIEFYTKAANKGLAEAQFALGRLYAEAEDRGNAIKWCSSAAEQSNAEAQCFLGTLYLEEGLDKEALDQLENAAYQGLVAEAFFILGKCYEEGRVVKQDKFTALDHYKEAAKLGSEVAKKILAAAVQEDEKIFGKDDELPDDVSEAEIPDKMESSFALDQPPGGPSIDNHPSKDDLASSVEL